MTLTIEAFDGLESIGQGSVSNITIGVGKGGKGATILVPTAQCDSDVIKFVATFAGLDEDSDVCLGVREISKDCR